MKKIQMLDVMRLISEGKESEAREAMKQLIIQESRKINESFIAEELEDELTIGDELESELSAIDPELDSLSDEIEGDMIMDDGSEELEDLDGGDAVEELEDRVEDVEDAIESLRADFEELMSGSVEDELEGELEGEGKLEGDELDGELEGEGEELESDIEEIEDEESN